VLAYESRARNSWEYMHGFRGGECRFAGPVCLVRVAKQRGFRDGRVRHLICGLNKRPFNQPSDPNVTYASKLYRHGRLCHPYLQLTC